MKKLTNRQYRFIDEYLIDSNATRAYIAAGYSPKLANTHASKLLRNATIAELIKEKQQSTSQRLNVTRESIIQDLLDIIEAQKEDFPGVAIKGIEVLNKMQGWDKPIEVKEEVKDTKIQVEIIIPKDYKDESESN
jgi:phage terminase small subunit